MTENMQVGAKVRLIAEAEVSVSHAAGTWFYLKNGIDFGPGDMDGVQVVLVDPERDALDELVESHHEWNDDDCATHLGCSCSWEPPQVKSWEYDEQRKAWRKHLAAELRAAHFVIR